MEHTTTPYILYQLYIWEQLWFRSVCAIAQTDLRLSCSPLLSHKEGSVWIIQNSNIWFCSHVRSWIGLDSVGCIDWTLIKSYKIDRPDLLEYMDFHWALVWSIQFLYLAMDDETYFDLNALLITGNRRKTGWHSKPLTSWGWVYSLKTV